ncbi:hypothetical protein SRHO_G00254090 [Serrasalmus rhombeus]
MAGTPVSKPVIRNQTEKRSVSLRESWSPLCSVENGKDVSLSWYEEKERIFSISSSDSSERLYLPLNKTNSDCSTYTCVAANPVSTQTTQLDITLPNICIKTACEDAELNYAEVKTKPHSSNEAHEVNRAGGTEVQDQTEPVVYSPIRT